MKDEKDMKAEVSEKAYRQSIKEFRSALDNPPFTCDLLAKLHINGTVFVCVLVAYFLGRFRFSISIALGLIYCFSFVFHSQYLRYSRSLKALVYKTAIKAKATHNSETVEWLNGIIARVWRVLEPEVSKQVFREINPLLQEKCPPFLSSVKLTTFTLGSMPPRVDGIAFVREHDEQCITFECIMSFMPLQVGQDAHAFVAKTRRVEWNSRIELAARFGAKNAGIDLPVLVREIAFAGRLRVTIRLVRSLSVAESVRLSFVEDPMVDFTVVPLRTVDLMNVPLLSSWIHSTLSTALRQAMVDPQAFTVDLRKTDAVQLPGILVVHLGALRLREQKSARVELAIDGRRIRQTRKVDGPKAAIDEFFFVVVDGNDSLLTMRVVSDNRNGALAEGSIDLSVVRAIGAQTKALRLAKQAGSLATLQLHLHHSPLNLINEEDFGKDTAVENQDNLEQLEDKQKSSGDHVTATKDKELKSENDTKENEKYQRKNLRTMAYQKRRVLRVTIIGAEDLRAATKHTPSPYFTVLVAPRPAEAAARAARRGSPMRFVADTVAATATLLGGAVGAAGNVLTGGGSHREELLGSSDTTCFAHRSKTIIDSHAPLFNERMSIVSRDLAHDTFFMTLIDSNDDSQLGNLAIPICDLTPGDHLFKLKDCQAGSVRLSCQIFSETEHPRQTFTPYNRAVRLSVHSIVSSYDEGVFFFIIETKDGVFFHECFQIGDFFTKQEILFPIISDTFTITLFKENTRENEKIGSCVLTLLPEHAREENSQLFKRILPSASEIYAQHFSTNAELSAARKEDILAFIDEMSLKQNTKTNIQCFTETEALETGMPLLKHPQSENSKMLIIKKLHKIMNESIKQYLQTINHKTDLNALVRGGILKNDFSSTTINENSEIESNPQQNDATQDKIKQLQTNDNISTTKLYNKNEETGEITYSLESASLMKYKGTYEAADNFKIIQAKFTSFENAKEDFFVEFYNNDELVQRSQKSTNRTIKDCFTFLCGKSEIRAVFKSAKQGKNTFLGDCLIAKRQTHEKMMLDEKSFQSNLETSVFGCNFTKIDRIDKGMLQIFIKHCKNLKKMDQKSSDPYIKLLINNTKILKTSVKKNTLNPIFNECCRIKTRRTTDILRIELYEWNQIESNRLVAYREFPLYFLKEGFMDFAIKLIDAKTLEMTPAEVQIAFSFQKLTDTNNNLGLQSRVFVD